MSENKRSIKIPAEVAAAVNETGLVPMKCTISEAGLGLRNGEIRGFVPEVAAQMLAAGHGEVVSVKAAKSAKPE